MAIACFAHVIVPAACGANATESIESLARRYGFGAPLRMGEERVLRSRYSTVVFTANSRKLSFNNTLIWLNSPTQKGATQWRIALSDSQAILDPLLRPSATLGGDRVTTIVLDPGHGGHDTGAIGYRRVFEKKAALDVARRTRDVLKAAGLQVRLTRDRDYFIPLARRTDLASQWGADLFVSIHFNASPSKSVEGIETYVCTSPGFGSTNGGRADTRTYEGNRFDRKNALIGYYLHRGLLTQTRAKDRGIKRARFEVLRAAPCPAALVECAFISNENDATRVISLEYRAALARGIANGIVSYVAKTKTN